MAIEEIIEDIVSTTGLSKEEVLLKVKNKQSELSGLVSEEGAAYIVANELGVKTKSRVVESAIPIANVQRGMKSVTVNGRIMQIFGPHEFKSKKGYVGKVVNLIVSDKSGSIRVVLWNMSDIRKVEEGNVKVGDIVQIKNGYVREGFKGGLEINLGSRGILVTDPFEVEEREFPEVGRDLSQYVHEIKKLHEGMNANVIVRVRNNLGTKKFEKNGKSGKVANLIVGDRTGSIRLVLWDGNAEISEEVSAGDILKIENGIVKAGLRGLEIHANNFTKIEKNPGGVNLDLGDLTRRVHINELSEMEFPVEIRGVVVDFLGRKFSYNLCPNCNKRVENNVCRKCGVVQPKKLLVLKLIIDDGFGTVRVVLFRDNVEKFLEMKLVEIDENLEKTKARIKEIIGTEYIFKGRAKINKFNRSLEFQVYSFEKVNPKKEAEKILSSIEKVCIENG